MIQNPQPTKLLYLEYSPACCYWSFIKIFLLVSISKNFTIDDSIVSSFSKILIAENIIFLLQLQLYYISI